MVRYKYRIADVIESFTHHYTSYGERLKPEKIKELREWLQFRHDDWKHGIGRVNPIDNAWKELVKATLMTIKVLENDEG